MVFNVNKQRQKTTDLTPRSIVHLADWETNEKTIRFCKNIIWNTHRLLALRNFVNSTFN